MPKSIKTKLLLSSAFIIATLTAICLFGFFQTKNSFFLVFLVLSLISVLAVFYYLVRQFINPMNELARVLKSIDLVYGKEGAQTEIKNRQETDRLIELFDGFVTRVQNNAIELTNHTSTVNTFMSVLLDSAIQTSSHSGQNSMKIESITSAVRQMESSQISAAQEMEHSAMSVNMIAAAAEEMSATSKEVSENISKTRDITQNAVEQTSEISGHINELGQRANEIGVVIEAINEISAQTNLLALNATIEAARAGDAGKGFAVVASEIKELSRQTADATVEIKKKIEGIQASTAYAVSRMQTIYDAITDSNDIVAGIVSSVEEQALATKEIAVNIAQTSISVSNVNHSMSVCSDISRGISENISEINDLTNAVLNDSIKMEILSKEATKLTSHIKEFTSENKALKANFDISKVKNAHLNWRVNLESALKGYKKIRVEDVADHHGCDFGKWYDGSGQIFSSYPVFLEVGKHHEQVHVYIKKIVSLINEGQKKKAESLANDFELVREKLFNALDELYRQG